MAQDGARPRALSGPRDLAADPERGKALLPLIEEKYFVGAMLDAADGNLDPSGTTHAYAKAAKIGGAEIYLRPG